MICFYLAMYIRLDNMINLHFSRIFDRNRWELIEEEKSDQTMEKGQRSWLRSCKKLAAINANRGDNDRAA